MCDIENEISIIVEDYTKKESPQIQEFEKCITKFNNLVEHGIASNRGYQLQPFEDMYNCQDNLKIRF